MIFGLTTSTFTFVHVLLSLVGIGSGFVVVYGLLVGKRLDGWTAIFLATTVATSLTGFAFPFEHLLPSHKIGKEPPFLVAQLVVLVFVLGLTILAAKRFHIETARAA